MGPTLLRRIPRFISVVFPPRFFPPAALSGVVGVLLVGASHAADTSTPSLTPLLEQGLSGLALAVVDQSEPDARDTDAWSQWLRRKVAVAEQAGDWEAVLDQWRAFSAQIPPGELREWMATRAAQAYVATHQGSLARQLLSSLMWSNNADQAQVREWRWTTIRSYLDEQRFADGYDALLRYQQDYAAFTDDKTALVKAELLLAMAQYREAVVASASLTHPVGRAVHLVARMRLELTITVQDALAVIPVLGDPALHGQTRTSLVETLAALAAEATHGPQRIDLAEQLVLAGESADALWESYEGYGAQLANQLQLLKGDYEPWLSAAQRLGQTSSVQAKAIYGWMALNAPVTFSQIGHNRLAAFVAAADPALLRPLYTAAPRLNGSAAVPAEVLDRVLTSAIDAQDGALARAILLRMEEAETGATPLHLRHAAVDILAEDYASAAGALARVIEAGNSMTAADFDDYRDTALALLSAGEAGSAHEALAAVLPRVPELGARQQVLYWMARARAEQHRYVDAADLFVSAATTLGNGPLTEWSRQAWLGAAESLALAELPAEAVKIYEKLLDGELDGAQRVLVRQQLQQLRKRVAGAPQAS